MAFLWGLIIGVFIGATLVVGVIVMAICFAAGDYYPDRELERYVDGVWRD